MEILYYWLKGLGWADVWLTFSQVAEQTTVNTLLKGGGSLFIKEK